MNMTPASIFKKDVKSLLMSLKKDIQNDYRAHEDDTIPGMLVTIGAKDTEDGIDWNYQTGDNSFTGGAYGYADWAVVSLHRRSNCQELADDIYDQIFAL